MKKNMGTAGLAKKGAILFTAVAIAAGGCYEMKKADMISPEFPSYVDNLGEASTEIKDDSVPLADSQVSRKTEKKTTKKTVKLKKASKKSYKVKKPAKTKTTTKTTKKTNQTVTVETTAVTSVVEKYKKKSKKKVVTTTVETTTVTTITQNGTTPVSQTITGGTSTSDKANSAANVSSSEDTTVRTIAVDTIAPKADANLLNAYNTLKFDVTINPTVSYSGFFDAKSQSITVKRDDGTIYHELGHFLAFVAGNVDKKSDFIAVYNEEKSQYTGTNKSYVTQDASEYFAESYRDYVDNPSTLQSARPKTYAIIVQSLAKLTDSNINQVWKVYKAGWEKQ